MSTIDKYPKFCDGQILTSTDLNNSFDYLNEQINKTRSLLFGHGIISGLNPSSDFDCSYIKISKGKAITKDGSLIELKKDVVCTFAEKCDTEEEKYYLYEHQENVKMGSPVNQFKNELSKYLIGIDILKTIDEPVRCSKESCSFESTSVKISYRPFLIKKEKVKTERKSESELILPKLTNIIHSRDLAIFLRRITDYYYEVFFKLKNRLSMLPSFSETVDFKELAVELNGQKFNFKTTKAAAYLSFLFDLCKAINEYVVSYNEYITKYRIDYDPNEEMDSVVILGNIEDFSDVYRESYTEYYQDYGRMKNRVILDRLSNRIECIIGCFNPELINEDNPVFILPQKKNGLLGERVIPAYYGSSETAIMSRFKEYWDAHNYEHSVSLTQDEFHKDDSTITYQFHQADAFHINGYSGMDLRDFKEQINKQILDYNLPIQFVGFYLVGKKESFALEEYNKSEVKMNEQLIEDCCKKNLSQDKMNYLISPDKIWGKIEKAYRDNNVVEGSEDLIDLVKNSKLECDNTVNLEQFRQSIYLLINSKKEELQPIQKHFLDFVIRSIVYATEKDDLSPKARYGAEFTGDVFADNVLVAICHYNRVVLCLNMNSSDYLNSRDEFVVLKDDTDLVDLGSINQCFAFDSSNDYSETSQDD